MSWVISTIAVPVSRPSSAIRSRISACTVTSSAVVGSSAISSSGEQAMAAAIITRWRMPPDSSCGYWFIRRAASGMRTCFSHSSALALAAASLIPRCSRSGSAICSPIRTCGVSAVSGSWKIIVIFEPRILFSARGFSPSSSWPLNRIEPLALPLAASRPMAAMKVWLLPEPLSPTTPSTSPRATLKETPRTALTIPSWVLKSIFRSSMERTGSANSTSDQKQAPTIDRCAAMAKPRAGPHLFGYRMAKQSAGPR